MLYVNDLVNAAAVLFALIFADDTSLYLTGTNIKMVVKAMNNELEHYHKMATAQQIITKCSKNPA